MRLQTTILANQKSRTFAPIAAPENGSDLPFSESPSCCCVNLR